MNGDLGIISKSGSLESTVVVCVDNSAVKVTIGSNSSFLVIEPLSSNTLKIAWSHMTNSCGYLSSRNDTIQVSNLKSVSIANVTNTLILKKIIKVFVSGSENFGLIKLYSLKLTS